MAINYALTNTQQKLTSQGQSLCLVYDYRMSFDVNTLSTVIEVAFSFFVQLSRLIATQALDCRNLNFEVFIKR